MKSLLLGNGVNIQFGGKAYSNYFIMQRITLCIITVVLFIVLSRANRKER